MNGEGDFSSPSFPLRAPFACDCQAGIPCSEGAFLDYQQIARFLALLLVFTYAGLVYAVHFCKCSPCSDDGGH